MTVYVKVTVGPLCNTIRPTHLVPTAGNPTSALIVPGGGSAGGSAASTGEARKKATKRRKKYFRSMPIYSLEVSFYSENLFKEVCRVNNPKDQHGFFSMNEGFFLASAIIRSASFG